MRTTLDIDDDVLRASKALAERQGTTAGKVLSELARRALSQSEPSTDTTASEFLGFRPFPKRGAVVTNADVDRLRDESEF